MLDTTFMITLIVCSCVIGLLWSLINIKMILSVNLNKIQEKDIEKMSLINYSKIQEILKIG